MDWDNLQAGLAAWFAMVSGIAQCDVAWEGEPIGARNFPTADLLLDREAAERGTDETRYTRNSDGTLTPYVVGNRMITLSITVRSRAVRGSAKAAALLARVRTQLATPFTLDMLEALQVSAREAAPLQRSTETVDGREMSVATLVLQLAYTVCEADTEGAPTQPVEHIVLSGTVTPVGDVPEQIIP